MSERVDPVYIYWMLSVTVLTNHWLDLQGKNNKVWSRLEMVKWVPHIHTVLLFYTVGMISDTPVGVGYVTIIY